MKQLLQLTFHINALKGSIDNFFKRKLNDGSDESGGGSSKRDGYNNEIPQRPQPSSTSPSPFVSVPTTIDLNDLPSDPADRPKVTTYHPNQREEIRRAYWIKGPCQPKGHIFPSKKIGPKLRRFVVEWFDEFDWLEYSIKEEKGYCLCCYLFGDIVGQQGGREAFVTEGFSTWSKKEIVICSSFRGHDESGNSISRGLFIETLSLLREHNESIYNVTLDKASKNDKLTSPKIQKDIIKCFSQEIMKSICDEIGKDVFAVLVDESSDVSKKEQMAIVLRYVDSLGIVKERFVGIVHVTDTSYSTLKAAIDTEFSDNKLSMAQVRGQGYDGASNMCGEFNGLKALILKDNKSAHYVHCFAHQVQLVVVAVAKNHDGAHDFFEHLALVVNVVCASCKRKDMIRDSYKERVQAEISNGETETGRGLNQELSLIRAGDTRWGSHYKTIISLMNLFPEVVEASRILYQDVLNEKIKIYWKRLHWRLLCKLWKYGLFLAPKTVFLLPKTDNFLQKTDLQQIRQEEYSGRSWKLDLAHLRREGFSSRREVRLFSPGSFQKIRV
ncbi:hypothetical protein OSB04_012552 [Centaurea solstitialis]|uniref:TTF-type domain-containing protein n=1 Tax=Centaurea solstitialis TaxID=347529 RepID=A0AA38TBL8_9ASTR|nr:hypothetical protein OSB04_012552 [Centaurea solstitialis]